MTNERKYKIIEAIQQMMQVKGFSQRKMSNYIGNISVAQLNHILNNQVDKVSAANWLRLEAKFIQRTWGIYETGNFKAIQKMCRDSQENSTSNCISDYTAAGKTVGLKEYSRRNANAFYVLCDNMMGVKDLAREMQAAVGIAQEGTARNMMISVVRELKKLQNPVMIIDEMDKLNDRCLMALKMVYDRLGGRCGFVSAGSEVLRERIDKFAKRNKLGYREFKRRFAVYRTLNRFDTSNKEVKAEVIGICQDQGIEDKSQITYILNRAKHYDDVRTMIQDFQQRNKQKASTLEVEQVA